MIVGARLKEARKKQNLSQEALGELLGVSKSAISLYESEKRNPSLESVVELIYILGVSADYLLGSEVIVEVKGEEEIKYRAFTKEEVAFISDLRKDKLLYEILLENHKRGIELIKKRIG